MVLSYGCDSLTFSSSYLECSQDEDWNTMTPFTDPSSGACFLSGTQHPTLTPQEVLEILAFLNPKTFGHLLRQYVHADTRRLFLVPRYHESALSALKEIKVIERIHEDEQPVRLLESLSMYLLSRVMQGASLMTVEAALPTMHEYLEKADNRFSRDAHWTQETRPPAYLLLCLLHLLFHHLHVNTDPALASHHRNSASDLINTVRQNANPDHAIVTQPSLVELCARSLAALGRFDEALSLALDASKLRNQKTEADAGNDAHVSRLKSDLRAVVKQRQGGSLAVLQEARKRALVPGAAEFQTTLVEWMKQRTEWWKFCIDRSG